MKVYEAFCGIGGFSLGFQRAGFEIAGGCEIDPYAREVYKKNFGIEPDGDIRAVDHVSADIICGGFPCQPFSVAGLQLGTEDERNLWPELARIIRASQPRWVVLENVPALLSIERGTVFGRILRDLAACGYDAEWDCLTASQFGAPHQRSRLWIVAYPSSPKLRNKPRRSSGKSGAKPTKFRNDGKKEYLANTESDQGGVSNRDSQKNVADSNISRGKTIGKNVGNEKKNTGPFISSDGGSYWSTEPAICRVADGVSNRSHRLKCLGNAIVPQIAEWIAERIREIEKQNEEGVI